MDRVLDQQFHRHCNANSEGFTAGAETYVIITEKIHLGTNLIGLAVSKPLRSGHLRLGYVCSWLGGRTRPPGGGGGYVLSSSAAAATAAAAAAPLFNPRGLGDYAATASLQFSHHKCDSNPLDGYLLDTHWIVGQAPSISELVT